MDCTPAYCTLTGNGVYCMGTIKSDHFPHCRTINVCNEDLIVSPNCLSELSVSQDYSRNLHNHVDTIRITFSTSWVNILPNVIEIMRHFSLYLKKKRFRQSDCIQIYTSLFALIPISRDLTVNGSKKDGWFESDKFSVAPIALGYMIIPLWNIIFRILLNVILDLYKN